MPVEPTRSQNITVRCRRSPTASATGAAVGVAADRRAGAAVTAGVCTPRVATQMGNCVEEYTAVTYDGPTPKSFRSSAVRLGRTFSVISLSRNAASYLPEAKAPQPAHHVHKPRPLPHDRPDLTNCPARPRSGPSAGVRLWPRWRRWRPGRPRWWWRFRFWLWEFSGLGY